MADFIPVLTCTNSAFDSGTGTLHVIDQVAYPSTSTFFTLKVEDNGDNPGTSYVIQPGSVTVVGAPAGLDIWTDQHSSTFDIRTTLTPANPLGGNTYSSVVQLMAKPEGNNPYQLVELNIHVDPLIYRVLYYDNGLIGVDGAKLVAQYTAPEFVNDKGAWNALSTYNIYDIVTYAAKTWHALKSISTPGTPPAEGTLWTAFPDPDFHVKAAKSPSSTVAPTRVYAKVFFNGSNSFTTNGLMSDAVFYENGNTGTANLVGRQPTGVLYDVNGDGTVFLTKADISGAPYEASMIDSTQSTSDDKFYFTFTYKLNGVALKSTSPAIGPKMPVQTELSSTFDIPGITIPGDNAVACQAGNVYDVNVLVAGHLANLTAGTNYADIWYGSSDYASSIEAPYFNPITTLASAPVYLTTAPSNAGGTTGFKVKFNTPGTYYLIGRPTGDLNKECTTLTNLTNKALKVVVAAATSTNFSIGPFPTIPPTGTFDIPINCTGVTSGSGISWTLKAFGAVNPVIALYELPSGGIPVSRGTIVAGVTWTYNPAYSYFLRVQDDTNLAAPYVDILTLTNTPAGISSSASLPAFTRPAGVFNAQPETVTQGTAGGTIRGSYTGLSEALHHVTPSNANFTFGPSVVVGTTSGTFTVPITNAVAQGTYIVTLSGQNASNVEIASTTASVTVNAPTGRPSLTTYNSCPRFICQTDAAETAAPVCGSWDQSMRKPIPGGGTSVNSLYFVLKDAAGANTKAGAYSVQCRLLPTDSWTTVVPAASSETASGNFATFLHVAKNDLDTAAVVVSFNADQVITSPSVYLRVGLSGVYSDDFKIFCIPNIQIISGTAANLTSHVATIENDAAALFRVNTKYDGYTQPTIIQYYASNTEALFVSFPDDPSYIVNGAYDFSQRLAKTGNALSYNLFFQTEPTSLIVGADKPFHIKHNSVYGETLIYTAKVDIIAKNSTNFNFRDSVSNSSTTTATVGSIVNFATGSTQKDRLSTYRQTTSDVYYILNEGLSPSITSYSVQSTDKLVYIVASAGSTVGAIKYTITGAGCTFVPTTNFLDNVFNLATASSGQKYPANTTIGGIKLPSSVEVIQGDSFVTKTVKNDGSGWLFLSANYGITNLTVDSTSKIIKYGTNALNFQITQATPGAVDYRLGLVTSLLELGGLSSGGTLSISFKASFTDGSCATMTKSMPIRQFTYVLSSVPVACNACDYFPPPSVPALGSAQFDVGADYTVIEEAIVNGVNVPVSTFSTGYGLSIVSPKLSTGLATTPLRAATLNSNYYGANATSYSVYLVLTNSGVTNTKKIVYFGYNTTYTKPTYLPYPDKIGLASSPTGTDLSCYEGDKVYVSFASTLTTPPFSSDKHKLVFINGTTVIDPSAVYSSPTKTYSFTVPPGGIFTTNTPYTVAVQHTSTDCIYTSSLTFKSGGVRPSGHITISEVPEQVPCVQSILVNASSDDGTDLRGITRVQVYKTNPGTVPSYVGDTAVWDNITPSVDSTGKRISFSLNNTTKQFPSTITDLKEQGYFVNFYTGSSSGGYNIFEQQKTLILRSKNPTLVPSQSNPQTNIAWTEPVSTLYENTLTISCTDCKDGICNTTDLSTVSGITWNVSLDSVLPSWLEMTPVVGDYSKVLLHGAPDVITPVSFTINVSVPYYTSTAGTLFHDYSFVISLTPTADFTIGSVSLDDAIHYQTSYSQTLSAINIPTVDCSSLTWSITDRGLAGSDKDLPLSTVDSPIAITGGVFTWDNVDDSDAAYPVTYVFGVQAVCSGGSVATGEIILVVNPRNPIVGSITPVFGYFDITNETVTIQGLDFYPGEVKFDGVSATNVLVNVTNDAITCTPPNLPDIGGEDRVVEVIVYNSDGGQSQSGIEYTYQRKRNPIINSIIPSGGTFRGGTKVAIIGANFEPTSTVVIDDVLQPILSITPTAIIFVTMPHSVGFASVQVTNSVPPASLVDYIFAAEPRVTDVQPYNIPADGGIDVYIIGTDFQEGVRVFLDDYEIPSDRITVL